MSLTISGKAFAETIPAKDIQALVFCSEGAIVPPYSNGYIPSRLLRHSNPGRDFVFEPSYKHRSNCSDCDTYDGLVLLDDTIVKPGIFNIVMTNMSNRHIKVNRGQTTGMLRTCKEEQICPICKIATLHSSKIGSRPRHQHYDNGEECPSLIKEDTQKLYHIPTWNTKMGKVEVNTLMRDEPSAGIDINEIGPQQDFVEHKKSQLHDSPIDRKTKLDLEKLSETKMHLLKIKGRLVPLY